MQNSNRQALAHLNESNKKDNREMPFMHFAVIGFYRDKGYPKPRSPE